MKREFTDKEWEIINKCAENHVTIRELELKLKTDIRIVDREYQLKYGTKYPRKGRKFIYNNPFSNLEDPNVQYWLGWLATDGHVGDTIRLSLQRRDRELVCKFAKFLGDAVVVHDLIEHNKYFSSYAQVKNKEIINFLFNIGFSSNKTFNFNPVFKFSPAYIRGCFEGDGYFRPSGQEVSIVSGCLNHLNMIKEYLNNQGFNHWNIYIKNKNRKNPLYILTCTRRLEIIKFFNFIYQDAGTNFLERKYLTAWAICKNSQQPLKFGELASRIPSQA